MKLQISFTLDYPELPLDYRSGMISLLKACFEKSDELFYHKLYDEKTDKPYTFSVFFPELTKNTDRIIKTGKKGILYFSTNDYVTLINLYNGALKLKEHKWQSLNKFKLESVNLINSRKINSNRCIFKTVSPFLINQFGNNLQYLVPENPDFDHSFRFNVQQLTIKFLNKELINFEYKILQHKKMVVSHYKQSMTTNKGIIEIKADADVLNLLYDIGIGVRRSQGFGMLDLI